MNASCSWLPARIRPSTNWQVHLRLQRMSACGEGRSVARFRSVPGPHNHQPALQAGDWCRWIYRPGKHRRCMSVTCAGCLYPVTGDGLPSCGRMGEFRSMSMPGKRPRCDSPVSTTIPWCRVHWSACGWTMEPASRYQTSLPSATPRRVGCHSGRAIRDASRSLPGAATRLLSLPATMPAGKWTWAHSSPDAGQQHRPRMRSSSRRWWWRTRVGLSRKSFVNARHWTARPWASLARSAHAPGYSGPAECSSGTVTCCISFMVLASAC